ncbi:MULTISPECIES: hypothetical protein [unclassified Pseudomonas]|jgi:hypothetical protein|uniref:hypothetical protein n=1 Tax=unclassified Pseudomonas TaxID=196821 RepID=UPI000C817275|nr:MULTISPECIES: hypothetical protein [unclassified Pseudomonas]MDX9669372.1 hypothetical protein [Pseudomonas sp. P8_250]PMQ08932.1 hypothetical protein PseAD21_22625 [Pseudomonas sp. AD21]WPN36588.1 hypothetical protein QMK53_02720 [Pseudomonas sp. P8_139]WPN41611.1 hypothetical protein QMK55_00150 [Pseudomonas sp. P8_229]
MLEHIWRSIHSPGYFPNVLEWMVNILLNPFMVIMCLMVGALAGKWWRAVPYGGLTCYVVFLSRSPFYRWGSIFPEAGLPALLIDGALLALLGFYLKGVLGTRSEARPEGHWLRKLYQSLKVVMVTVVSMFWTLVVLFILIFTVSIATQPSLAH